MLLLVGLVSLLALGDGAVVSPAPMPTYIGLPVGHCSMFDDIIKNTKPFQSTVELATGTWYPQKYLTAYSKVGSVFSTCPKFTYTLSGGILDFHATLEKPGTLMGGLWKTTKEGVSKAPLEGFWQAPLKSLNELTYTNVINSVHVNLMQLEDHLDNGIKTLAGQIKNLESKKFFQIRLLTFFETKDYRIRGICSESDGALDNVKLVFMETAQKNPDPDILTKMKSSTNVTGIPPEQWSSIPQDHCMMENEAISEEAKWTLEPRSYSQCKIDYCKKKCSEYKVPVTALVVGAAASVPFFLFNQCCCEC